MPKVNKELALKLIEEEEEKQKSTWKKKAKVRFYKAGKIVIKLFFHFLASNLSFYFKNAFSFLLFPACKVVYAQYKKLAK